MKTLFALLLILFMREAFAQNYVGDKPGNLLLGKKLFEKNESYHLNDFKEPLVIVNLMAIQCKFCIAALPKYDSILPAFDRQVKMIILLRGDKKTNEDFLKRRQLTRYKNLLFLSADDQFEKQFNRVGNPFHIWLNKERKIVALTKEEYITTQNLRKLLDLQESLGWPDITLPPVKPFIDVAAMLDNAGPVFFSYLQGYRQGYNTANIYSVDSSHEIQHWQLLNMPLTSLYKIAANTGNHADLANNRFLWEVKDSSTLFETADTLPHTQWIRRNYYCYEAVLPLAIAAQERAGKLLSDLNSYSGFVGKFVTRGRWCWVLQSMESNYKMNAVAADTTTTGLQRLVRNMNNHRPDDLFITDYPEARIAASYSFKETDLKTIDSIKEKMRSYNIRMYREKRMVEFFVVSN